MRPTNLLFLVSDNHARLALGSASGGLVKTPHLDALAARGARFTSLYTASPICCPARAAIATGRFPHETGYWDNAIAYDGRVRTWHHVLRDAGHRIAAIGKLHYRASEDDNGFSEEILPMHILDGKGGVSMLLRWNGEEPVNIGQWELYAEKAGEGTTSYQDYDRKITRQAVRWLRDRAAEPGQRPWALKVSYVSAHPPFSVPRRLLDLYDVSRIPLPPAFSPDERPEHPALRHFRRIFAYRDLTDTAMLRRIAAAYYALCTHLDEQIGEVLATLVVLGLTGDTRVIYTSDHGEALGAHGLFGKFQLFDPSACVPLIMAGPDVPESRVVTAPVSHVDLFPTIIESFGLSVQAPPPHGRSLWRTLETGKRDAPVFAEYHAAGSPAGMFMLRTEREKLIYHVGAPAQVYDMAADPQETRELGGTPAGDALAARLEAELRGICDPESVDRQAKADQMAKAEFWGGNEAIRKEGLLVYTPAPGEKPEIEGGAPS